MSKDIRGYFHSFSKHSVSSIAASSKDISNSDSENSDEESVTKSHVIVHLQLLARNITILKNGRQILSG